MKCRICSLKLSPLRNRREDELCKICAYVMEISLDALSHYWYDIIKENKKRRMKIYYIRRKLNE